MGGFLSTMVWGSDYGPFPDADEEGCAEGSDSADSDSAADDWVDVQPGKKSGRPPGPAGAGAQSE